jgi:periplasmic protein TonB
MRRSLTFLLFAGAAVLPDMPVAAQTSCVPQRPRWVHEPQGVFPFTLLDTGIEGRVVVQVVIGPDGLPKSMDVVESSGHAAFDTEAMRAVSRSRWQPMPCEAVVRVPIDFKQAK